MSRGLDITSPTLTLGTPLEVHLASSLPLGRAIFLLHFPSLSLLFSFPPFFFCFFSLFLLFSTLDLLPFQ